LGRFAPDSPVAAHLGQTHRPLTQYDIDMMSQFQATAAAEREWLAGLGLEVYVPIYAHENWIGLLGLGAKMSGNRYFDDDLLLLSTLADQTAVALENARLVADLKRLNRELEAANRRLQEADQLKSDFISAVTHEMRTPFANVDFALQLLQQEGTANLTASQEEELAKVKRGVARAREMVNDLVSFAAFLSKQGELQLSCFDLRQKMGEAVRPLQPLAENKEITVRVNGGGAPLPVRADPERLTDAIHHLVHNAIKFTDEGGAIHIRAWQEVGAVHFEVQDDGRGVPPEKLEELWEGFAQMANPVQRGVEGVGLGLPLVKYIVNAHRGDVYAHSRETVGSTFGFQIPAESTAVRSRSNALG
jgi:signal transduction histidine kinase